jgi:hypothetical protein
MKKQQLLINSLLCIGTQLSVLSVSAQEIDGVNTQPFVETFNPGEIPTGYTPPAINIEKDNPISSPTFNPYNNPFPNEFNDFNGSYGYGGFGSFSNSSSCGMRVNISPTHQRGEWNTQLGVSWNSKKCPDEEKIQKLKQSGELEQTALQSKSEVTIQAIKYCLEARETAITSNQDPDVVCPLSFIYDMKK